MAMKQSPSSSLDQSTHSTSTPEYIAMCKCYKMMVSHIKQSPGEFCDALFSEGYISPRVRDYARKESILEMERAEKLVDTMIDRVECDPKAYHGFVKMFEEEGSWVTCVVEELKKGYEYAIELQRSAIDEEEDSSSDESFHSLDGSFQQVALVPKDLPLSDIEATQRPLNEKSTATDSRPADNDDVDSCEAISGFICPYCKKCSVEEFFSKSGCQEKHSSENELLFPYLKTADLSEEEGEDLEAKLISDLKKIVHHYAVTEDSVIVDLESQDLSVDRVRNYTRNLVMSTASAQQAEIGIELKKADKIDKIFEAIQPFRSFFNYEIVESVVDQFGSPQSCEMMTKYIDAFNEFCKRNVFQVPPSVFRYQIKKSDDKVFSAKFTPTVFPALGDVVTVRRKIASILEVSVWALQLCSIKEGCVCLTFLVPAHVANKIFPVSLSQQTALSEIHIRVLEEPWSSHTVEERHQDQPRLVIETLSTLKLVDVLPPPFLKMQHVRVKQSTIFERLGLILSTKHLLSNKLMKACKRGSVCEVSYLIEQGANMNHRDTWNGRTPLIAACEGGHSETVKVLIDGKADLDKHDWNGKTPLMVAYEGGHSKTVKMLIDGKADLKKVDRFGRAPLMVACERGDSDTVKMLIDAKVDLDKVDRNGRTPLMVASRRGYSKTVKMLIDGKADLNKVDEDGRTPLIVACERGHSETVKMMIDGKADLNLSDSNGRTPLIAACEGGHSETVRMLIDSNVDLNKSYQLDGRTPLIAACEGGHSETVKILIDGKADLNQCDSVRHSPLYIARLHGHSDIVRMLEKNGAKMTAWDEERIVKLPLQRKSLRPPIYQTTSGKPVSDLSSGHGSEMSPRHGSEMSPRHGSGMSLGHSSEMSLGHSSEMSLGHSSDMSLGHSSEMFADTEWPLFSSEYSMYEPRKSVASLGHVRQRRRNSADYSPSSPRKLYSKVLQRYHKQYQSQHQKRKVDLPSTFRFRSRPRPSQVKTPPPNDESDEITDV